MKIIIDVDKDFKDIMSDYTLKAISILEDFGKWLEEESAKNNMQKSDLQAFIKQALNKGADG